MRRSVEHNYYVPEQKRRRRKRRSRFALERVIWMLISALGVLCVATVIVGMNASGDKASEARISSEVNSYDNSEVQAVQTSVENKKEYLDQEWVLADSQDIVLKITGFEKGGLFGTTMMLYLENKTDRTQMFSIDSCAVNGVMNDPLWAKEIPPRSKANEKVTWGEIMGGEFITVMDASFRVYDSNDWTAEDILNQEYTVYPLGKDKSNKHVRDGMVNDIVLFDNDQAAMLISGFRNDEIWGYSADVYIVNKSNKKLMFAVENSTVNGFSCDPFWASEVRPNASAYSSITWSQEDLEINGIENVEEVSLAVKVYDSDDWMSDAIVEQMFTVNLR